MENKKCSKPPTSYSVLFHHFLHQTYFPSQITWLSFWTSWLSCFLEIQDGFPEEMIYFHGGCSIQCEAPPVISWCRFAPVTIAISTINHSEIGAIAILGASHCIYTSLLTNNHINKIPGREKRTSSANSITCCKLKRRTTRVGRVLCPHVHKSFMMLNIYKI